MRTTSGLLFGCMLGVTGCTLVIDLDAVRDNTGAAGRNGGGASGSESNAGTVAFSNGGAAGRSAASGASTDIAGRGNVAGGGNVATSDASGAAGKGTNGGESIDRAGGGDAGRAGAAGTPTNGGASVVGNPAAGAAGRAGGATGGAGANSFAGSGWHSQSGGATSLGGAAGTTAGTTGTAGTSARGPKSCQNLVTLCQGESCCTSIAITGGTFKMGRSTAQGSSDYYENGLSMETPEHDATVTTYALDKYEVTVGRFRKFVENYDAWRNAGNPVAGDGANPNAPNTGWAQSGLGSDQLPADAHAVKSLLNAEASPTVPPSQTWADDAAKTDEAYPINYVSWYLAFAFCIWDGGRLPTEAEWEYAAAGGPQNRLFPWGNQPADSSRANYSPYGSPRTLVGSKSMNGTAYFGHEDLAGSLWEWVFDWFSDTFYGTDDNPASCVDCANANSYRAVYRVARGGSYLSPDVTLRAAERYNIFNPDATATALGFRCARKL